MVKIPVYREIPYSIRKNPEKRWNYLAKLLNGGSEDVTSEPQVTTRNVSISVNDGTDPIQGASVVIGEATKTTGSAGGCSFNGLTDGEYEVSVSAEGYTTKTETITVASDSTSFTITLTAA